MNQKVIEFNKDLRGKKVPPIQSGDVVRVHLRIKEGEKERVQVFEGLVIAKKGGQSSSPTITVRKVSNGVGVEMILPILSKNVQKIELVKRAKTRRSKLYYVRGLTAKQSRMKYDDTEDFVMEEEAAPKADEKKSKKKEDLEKTEKPKKEETQKKKK
jgi:large subunit ribosomal protein L19